MTRYLLERQWRIAGQLVLAAVLTILSLLYSPRLSASYEAKAATMDEAAQTFAADCVTPKTTFFLGEVVCGKIIGAFVGSPAQRHFEFADPIGYIRQHGPPITAGTQTVTFTLPATSTSIIGGVISVDNRGAWRLASVDNSAEGQAAAFFNVMAQGLEGDVAPRPDGDGAIQSNDVVQVQRFQIGLDSITSGTSEFLRADSAPLATGGDGSIQSNDVVQTQRFQIGLDPLQNASTPEFDGLSTLLASNDGLQGIMGLFPDLFASTKAGTPIPARRLAIDPRVGTGSREITFDVVANSRGDESAYGFTLSYDPAVLFLPKVMAGAAGGSRLCNTSVRGKITCSISNFAQNAAASSSRQIGEIRVGDNQQLATITLKLVSTGRLGPASVGLVKADASNDLGAALPIKY
jgi:hypothetical protein